MTPAMRSQLAERARQELTVQFGAVSTPAAERQIAARILTEID